MSKGTVAILAVAALGLALWLYQSGYFGDNSDGGGDLTVGDGSASGLPTDQSTSGVGNMQYTGTLIQDEEGLVLTAVPDAGGYSIGYGHHSSDVTAGETITQSQADALFQQDVQTAVDFVNNNVSIPLTQGEFNALVDFVYNVGVGTASAGTVFSQLNSGSISGAVNTLLQYVNSGGQFVASLLARRQVEASSFPGASS